MGGGEVLVPLLTMSNMKNEGGKETLRSPTQPPPPVLLAHGRVIVFEGLNEVIRPAIP